MFMPSSKRGALSLKGRAGRRGVREGDSTSFTICEGRGTGELADAGMESVGSSLNQTKSHQKGKGGRLSSRKGKKEHHQRDCVASGLPFALFLVRREGGNGWLAPRGLKKREEDHYQKKEEEAFPTPCREVTPIGVQRWAQDRKAMLRRKKGKEGLACR